MEEAGFIPFDDIKDVAEFFERQRAWARALFNARPKEIRDRLSQNKVYYRIQAGDIEVYGETLPDLEDDGLDKPYERLVRAYSCVTGPDGEMGVIYMNDLTPISEEEFRKFIDSL